MTQALPNLLDRTREEHGEELIFRFGNGLSIRTEILLKRDTLRILPLGGPQGTLMNYMLTHPDSIRGKRVFEPFAGSGPLGMMALKMDAASVDFLDVNPRAIEFQRRNGDRNGFDPSRYNAIEGSIADYLPSQKYDLIFANPPFVPTPGGIDGTLTSNGGPDGNRFVDVLLERLNLLLEPEGEAFIYVFQIVSDGVPLVVRSIERFAPGRPVELTPTQNRPVDFGELEQAYRRLFASERDAVSGWRASLRQSAEASLTVDHYVIHLGPRGRSPTSWSIRDNLAEKYGAELKIQFDQANELAFARAFENVVPA